MNKESKPTSKTNMCLETLWNDKIWFEHFSKHLNQRKIPVSGEASCEDRDLYIYWVRFRIYWVWVNIVQWDIVRKATLLPIDRLRECPLVSWIIIEGFKSWVQDDWAEIHVCRYTSRPDFTLPSSKDHHCNIENSWQSI